MDWQALQDVVAVAETGSLSAASRRLNVSQPTVGRRIEQLEQQLGAMLFNRTAQGLSLTTVGESILNHAKQMEKQANALLPEDEKFTVSPHALRHTLMRRIAEDPKYGIHYTKAASGHKSDKYVWTYTEPGTEELEELD